MANISLKATNLPSVAAAMQAFPEVNDRELGTSLRSGMEFAKAKARQLAPKEQGTLQRSIYVRTVKSSQGWSGTLGASAPHARIREYGGTIRAKNKPYLKFRARSGQFVQVKQVTQQATPYMRPALRQSRTDIVRELRSGMQRSLQTIVKAGG